MSSELPVPTADVRGPVWFLESIDRLHRAMQSSLDLGTMAQAVLDTIVEIFDCDRAWLVTPCDPASPTWSVAMERSKPRWARTSAGPVDLPMVPEMAFVLDRARAAKGPVCFGPGLEHPLAPMFTTAYEVQSGVGMALLPREGPSYVFGIHQCSHARRWEADELRLLEEFGRRMTDVLSLIHVHVALRESERRLAQAQTLARLGHFEVDLARGQCLLSAEAARLLGVSPGATVMPVAELRAHWSGLLHPDDRERALATLDDLPNKTSLDIDYRVLVRGNVRHLHGLTGPLREPGGHVVAILGSIQDVTELRQSEERLRASEQRFRIFVEHASDAVFLHGEAGVIMDVNQQACDALQYTREELLGRGPSFIDHGVSADQLGRLDVELRAGKTVTFESFHRRKDGSTFPVEIRIRPFWEGGVFMTLAVARDIGARKRDEEALRQSLNLLRAVAEGTSDAIFVKDLAGRYLMINSAGARFLGRPEEEIVGKHDRELFSPDTVDVVLRHDAHIIASERTETLEETLTAAGETHTYAATKGVYRDGDGKVIGLVGVSRDISGQKRLEAELRQAQKMEAVGRLAGGIAHDFNNLLTVINGCSELVRDALASDAPERELMGEVLRAGERAAELTSQLLAFSRKQVLVPQVLEVGGVVGDLLKMLRRLIGDDIALVFEPPSSSLYALVDRSQLEQSLVNLAINARDAMPQGGTLRIRIAEAHEGLLPRVDLSVSDTGCGMDEETRGRVFEPFFTTKGHGGTGLGLAMVYGFVTQSGGRVEIESRVGEGSTFRLLLPLSAPPKDVAASAPSEIPSIGHERVLLVEDADSVRTFARHVLVSSGYRVIEAACGKTALAELARAGAIDLLITDLVMPEMSGRDLSRAVRAILPTVPVLFVSGYTDESVADLVSPDDAPSEARSSYLQKPFSASALLGRVRRLLDHDE